MAGMIYRCHIYDWNLIVAFQSENVKTGTKPYSRP